MAGQHDALEALAASEFDQVRKELRTLKDKLNRITDITSGIIYILDVNGRFVYINNAVELILHYSPAEIIGRHFSEIMPPGEYERVARNIVLPQFIGRPTGEEKAPKLFDERRTGPRSTRNLEVQLVTKERRDVRILMGDVTGIIGVEGAYDLDRVRDGAKRAEVFLGSQGIIYDITRYKRVERDKFLLQQRLNDAQKMDVVGRLAGGLAHDFNNKLVAILGFSEMMKDTAGSVKDPVFHELLDKVIATTRQTEDLTRRLLAFAHVDAQDPAKVDLHDIIKAVTELMGALAGRTILTEQGLHAGASVIIGERSRLQNAILNIALNAVEAMPYGGRITLETGNARDENGLEWIRLSIVNTPAPAGGAQQVQTVNTSLQHALFEKDICFGLANVEECVKAHGGSMNVSEQEASSVRVDILLQLV